MMPIISEYKSWMMVDIGTRFVAPENIRIYAEKNVKLSPADMDFSECTQGPFHKSASCTLEQLQ